MMKTALVAGSKLVLEAVPLHDGTSWKMLKMDNDRQDTLAKAVRTAIDKDFAGKNDSMRALTAWIEECPAVDPKVAEPLIEVRSRALKLCKVSAADDYEAVAKYKDDLMAALKQVVAERKTEIAGETALLDRVADDLKFGRISGREQWIVRKFYAANDVVKFRPHNKFRLMGTADECYPPAYDPRESRTGGFFKK
jgi:hypothetical protein